MNEGRQNINRRKFLWQSASVMTDRSRYSYLACRSLVSRERRYGRTAGGWQSLTAAPIPFSLKEQPYLG
jgi:hypothetical protein